MKLLIICAWVGYLFGKAGSSGGGIARALKDPPVFPHSFFLSGRHMRHASDRISGIRSGSSHIKASGRRWHSIRLFLTAAGSGQRAQVDTSERTVDSGNAVRAASAWPHSDGHSCFLLLLVVLDYFRSRRTLLRLVLRMISLIVSGIMLAVAESVDVPDALVDAVLTRALESAARWLSYALVVTYVAVT